MQTAQQLRDATDPEAVRALIAAFPTPDHVGCRQQFDPQCILDRLPQALDARLFQLQARRAEQVTFLAMDIARYEELRAGGLSALSDYDCTISSTNNPLAGLHMAFSLKIAHICFANSKLAALELAIAETIDQMERERPQMDLF